MSTIYRRIRGDIEDRIRSGVWPEGHRIPFEHELAASYGCSRATVSKAVAALAESGLVERRKRAGTFVASPRIHSAVLDVPNIAELIAARGERYRYTLLERRDATGGGIFTGDVLDLSGLHCADGMPFAYESRTIALDVAPGAATVDFAREAPGSWLLREVRWTRATHRILAVNPAQEVADALGVDAATACLQLERTTWHGNAPVTFARQIFLGHRYDLTAAFERV